MESENGSFLRWMLRGFLESVRGLTRSEQFEAPDIPEYDGFGMRHPLTEKEIALEYGGCMVIEGRNMPGEQV